MSSLPDVCWMAVEPRYAADVQALLQSLRARHGADEQRDVTGASDVAGTTSASGSRRRHNSGGVVWSDEDYDAFIAADKESYRRVRAFCDVLADAAGQQLTTSRASAAADITPSQLRAALGKFSVWMGAAMDNQQWPFGWAYGEDVDPNNPAEFHYAMSEEQAAAWKAARQRRG